MTSQLHTPTPDLTVTHWTDALTDGTHVLIRPLQANDREREFQFIKRLSPQTRHFRFLCTLNEPGEALLDQLMDVDYHKRMAYVALFMEHGELTEIGVSRYAAADHDKTCECAVVVADGWQGRGLGRLLMKHLIDAARINGFERMISVDSANNTDMHRLARDLGFETQADPLDMTQVVYTLQL
jgi:GNAT superfamily N-acetyltransferase